MDIFELVDNEKFFNPLSSQNRKIPAEAMFSCEYVVKVEDEEWRAVIEAFWGIHRYSILVEPEPRFPTP